jgi:hypothetical protein
MRSLSWGTAGHGGSRGSLRPLDEENLAEQAEIRHADLGADPPLSPRTLRGASAPPQISLCRLSLLTWNFSPQSIIHEDLRDGAALVTPAPESPSKARNERAARGAIGGRMIEVIFSVAGIFPARSAGTR